MTEWKGGGVVSTGYRVRLTTKDNIRAKINLSSSYSAHKASNHKFYNINWKGWGCCLLNILIACSTTIYLCIQTWLLPSNTFYVEHTAYETSHIRMSTMVVLIIKWRLICYNSRTTHRINHDMLIVSCIFKEMIQYSSYQGNKQPAPPLSNNIRQNTFVQN